MPNKKIVKQITEQEMKLAQMLLLGLSVQDAADAVGIHRNTADAWAKSPCVVEWMETASKKVAEKTAEKAADKIAEASDIILSQYMALATLKANRDNGMVILKACDCLRNMLGIGGKPGSNAGEDAPKPPEIYKAAWMDEPVN